MYMKKVTTLLASLAFGWCCIAGPAAAATVAGVEVADALDQVGMKRYCCRRMYVGHIDLIYETAPFSTSIQ